MSDRVDPLAIERQLEVAAYSHYLATLVGNPAPIVERIGQRLKHPEVGDLVLEVSTIYDASRVGTRLGRLDRIAQEPVCSAEEWQAGGGSAPVPRETIWYLTLLNGDEYRWRNADFIAVLTEIPAHDRPLVARAAL